MNSNAESKVVAYLQKGYNNDEIAERLNISVKTVKFHLTNIYKKYDVKSRSQLMAKLYGWEPEEIIVKDIVQKQESKSLSQIEKIEYVNDQFRVGDTVNQLHHMMKTVTKDQINPATVNAACNCVARLNETISTAIQAAKFLNDR